ncbi:urease accessory protein UreF, partial [Ottowia sp.]|uniref:urease accessory protein UreF n=1 Tax=Ottowia sp. TaxID=1898956 RepID=UPI0039E51E77
MPAASLLQLIWLASPALPVGGFSYSEGLEAAVEWAGVGSEARAQDWLVDQLHLGLARSDLAVVAEAVRAWRADDRARVAALDAWVLATRESAEFRLQAEQMGRSFLEWLKLHHADAAACCAGLA